MILTGMCFHKLNDEKHLESLTYFVNIFDHDFFKWSQQLLSCCPMTSLGPIETFCSVTAFTIFEFDPSFKP